MNSKTSNGFSKTPVQVIVALAFVAAIVLAGPRANTEAQVIVTLSGSDRVFQGEVVEGMVILDAFKAAIQAGNLPLGASIDHIRDTSVITWQDGKVGDAVISVDAKMVDAKKIHHIPIRPGAVVAVKIL